MNERGEQRQNGGNTNHLYGRRAYDHGPLTDGESGAEDRKPDATEKPNGQPKPNGKGKADGQDGHDERRADENDGDHGQEKEQQGDGDRRKDREQPDDKGQDAHQAQQKDERPAPKPPSVSPRLPRRLAIFAVIVLVVAALSAGLLFWRHHHRLSKEAAARASQSDRGPRVFVTSVRTEPGTRELTLPADVRGFSQATVYAKVSGYVKSIVVDKGDTVRQGELLGVLESPEVDQQVAAAQADVVVKKRMFERYRRLVAKDFVSQQDFETSRAQYQVAEATLKQTRAMQDYETLRAPFAGTVTARYVDKGALVPAAAGATQSAQPLVDIADLGRLRILVFVQQDAAPFIHVGDPVSIAVDQRPGTKLSASIARCARALDPRSRTMLCEIWMDNGQGLYPGTFVHVTLRLKTSAFPIVPSSALLMHENKPAVAAIRDARVKFLTVVPGLDDGHAVQIKEGLHAGERIALDLPAEIAEGALVQPVERKTDDKGDVEKPGGDQKGSDPKTSGGDKPGGADSPGDGKPSGQQGKPSGQQDGKSSGDRKER
jgi:RND family efflux transporter MFP subunit